jgi:tetratricopeptide (TPR) repeat protein
MSGSPKQGADQLNLIPGEQTVAADPAGVIAAPRSQPSTFADGEVLAGRFRIVRFIARGGMGEVYQARDLELKEDVALKTIRAEIASDQRAIDRFRTEIHLARRITHPNACRIFDVFHHRGTDDSDTVFLTMELLRGETLSERLKRVGRLSVADALPLARQMAAALGAAHRAGVVHRDFKSANVMLVPVPDGERAVVTDFGLARQAAHDEAASTTLTAADQLAGTPGYMAPEQIENGPTTPATDVYALGVVLYEMVAGQRPFKDSSVGGLLKRLQEPAPSPRLVAPDLDTRWERTILRCLARDPADRFANAEDAVKALAGEEVVVGRGSAARRRRRMLGIAAAALVLLGGLAGWLLSRSRPVPAQRAQTGSMAVAARRSVAILGLRNLSGRADAMWLSTALAEMLGSELAAGETLRIVAGETVARMGIELALANADSLAADTLARVRAYLGADMLVVGSYTVLAGRIRLDLRLQDAVAGEMITSVSDSGAEGELFEMVSRTGARLRQKLGAAPRADAEAAGVRASLPAHPEAARLYAEGLAKLRVFDALGARPLLEKAVALDPQHPLSHSALGEAWSVLGYEARAREEAKRAFDLSGSLPREERLLVEARYRETMSDWGKAVEIYRALVRFFPDNLDYGLRLASAQTEGSQGKETAATFESLRRLPPPLGDDPRIDLQEAVTLRLTAESKRAVEPARKAAEKAAAHGTRHLLARARFEEGSALQNLGNLDGSQAALEEARRMFAEAGDTRGVAGSLNNLALNLANRGDLAGTARLSEEALKLYRSIGSKSGEALMQGNLGNVRYFQGDLRGAQRIWEQTLVTYREINDKLGIARMLTNMASAMADRGDLKGARTRWEEALSVWREAGHQSGVASTLQDIAKSLHQEGDLERAAGFYQECVSVFRSLAEQPGLASALVDQGDFLRARADLPGARRNYDEALALREGMSEKKKAADTRLALADLAIEEGRPAEAALPARQAIQLFAADKDADQEASAQGVLARSLIAQGRVDDARAAADRARELLVRSQNVGLRGSAEITAARVRAASDPPGAARELRAFLAANARTLPTSCQMDARLALAEIDLKRDPALAARNLATLEREARSRGFLLIARKAAALRQPP